MHSNDTPQTAAPATTGSNRPEDAIARRLLLGVVILLALWALSVVQFGVPGLYLPALAAVPVIWALLILISRG